MNKTSIYANERTKKRLESLKPKNTTFVGFLNTLADVWQGLTEQERITAILAHQQAQQSKEAI